MTEELAQHALGVDTQRHLGLLDGHRKQRIQLALALLLGCLLVLWCGCGGW